MLLQAEDDPCATPPSVGPVNTFDEDAEGWQVIEDYVLKNVTYDPKG